MAIGNDQRWSVRAVLALGAFWLLTCVCASPLEDRQLPGNAVSPYAPSAVTCPSTPLLRSSRKISSEEKKWAKKRHAKAVKALKKFLAKKGGFPELRSYPQIGLANGGGGIRGFLTAAGSRLAYDEREGSNYSTAGLLQAITYETALSGSSIMLGSYVENDNAKTTTLYNQLWKQGMANGLFMPDGPTGTGPAIAGILTDLLAKRAAGGDITAIDALGRLFGYVAFKPDSDGPAGVGRHLSAALDRSTYKGHNAPLPIFTALGVEQQKQGCGLPDQNATQYEFSPFEFGSYDPKVSSFTPTKYLGSSLSNGKPTAGLLGNKCFTGFDNTNFVVGTSTAILNQFCGRFGFDQGDAILSGAGLKQLRDIIDPIGGLASSPTFSFIPNPAYKSPKSPKVSALQTLNLVDGGENIQVIPTWPLIFRPEVKVIFMTDSSTYGLAQNRVNFPNGRSLKNNAVQAAKQGKGNRFPKIPGPNTFLKKGLTKRTVFFGCNLPADDPAATIIYLPNRKITYDSAVKTNQNKYTPEQSLGLLMNGAQVATEGNDPQFGFCAGCAITKRQAEKEGKKLPSGCAQCFKKYCYN